MPAAGTHPHTSPALPPGGDKGLPHHVQHDLVGHQLAAVQILLDGLRPAE
jgi:hypothetical protein